MEYWTYNCAGTRQRKLHPVHSLIKDHNGSLLFVGKVILVTRRVAGGLTRGSAVLHASADERDSEMDAKKKLTIEFENENLSAMLREDGEEEKLLAISPDLIAVLDRAKGAPLGVSDYRYGMRVSVIGLKAGPVWTSDKGLEMGGPKAFGLDMPYVAVSDRTYPPPKSVWEMYLEGQKVIAWYTQYTRTAYFH